MIRLLAVLGLVVVAVLARTVGGTETLHGAERIYVMLTPLPLLAARRFRRGGGDAVHGAGARNRAPVGDVARTVTGATVAPMDLYTEFGRIVGALNGEGVRYALAGGVAVSIYAAPRVTMAAKLPAGFVDDDRELASYAVAAETARPSGHA